MGDIFHTFPAISDIKTHFPNAEIDWIVEDSFKEIVAWHPGVRDVIPIHLRHWLKKHNLRSWREFKHWKKTLQQENYDFIIDAQGLVKSALISKFARGKRIDGYNKFSAREPLSSLFYDYHHSVSKNQHAVERTRQLIGSILGYQPSSLLNFEINQNFSDVQKEHDKLIFIIGTSWITKLWSANEWQKLARIATQSNFRVEIIWGSESEKNIADQIIDACPAASRTDRRLSITTIAEKLVGAAGVVGLDTGFSHLAGALETPTIALYGPTSPVKVGLIGDHTRNLQLTPALDCMPCHKRECKWLPEDSTNSPECMTRITAERVWDALKEKLNKPSPLSQQNLSITDSKNT